MRECAHILTARGIDLENCGPETQRVCVLGTCILKTHTGLRDCVISRSSWEERQIDREKDIKKKETKTHIYLYLYRETGSGSVVFWVPEGPLGRWGKITSKVCMVRRGSLWHQNEGPTLQGELALNWHIHTYCFSYP